MDNIQRERKMWRELIISNHKFINKLSNEIIKLKKEATVVSENKSDTKESEKKE